MVVSVAGALTLVATLLIFFITYLVIRSARVYEPDGKQAAYSIRKYYAGVLIVLALLALSITLVKTPYEAYADTPPAAIVDAEGMMWRWELKRVDEVQDGKLVLPLKQPIEFRVTASDITHGFGVYDPDGAIVGQVQAMPEYTNHLRLVFEKPGEYHVLCIEYCGTMHHNMVSAFTVQ